MCAYVIMSYSTIFSLSLSLFIYIHTLTIISYVYIHTLKVLYHVLKMPYYVYTHVIHSHVYNIHIMYIIDTFSLFTYIFTLFKYSLIERKPPPGGFSIYYVPWSRAVCKRFHDDMRRPHLVVKSLTYGSWSGNIVNRKPPRWGGISFHQVVTFTYKWAELTSYIVIV